LKIKSFINYDCFLFLNVFVNKTADGSRRRLIQNNNYHCYQISVQPINKTLNVGLLATNVSGLCY